MLDRVLLTLGTLVFAGVFYALMLKGWRGRQRRQSDLPAPPVATAADSRVVVAATPGLFIGTTVAGAWMDRVAVHHLSDRATAELTLRADGVHIEREGMPELFLPYDAVERAGLEEALAGKVISGGMLAVTWRLGARTLTSGFRATDHAAHARLVGAVNASIPAGKP